MNGIVIRLTYQLTRRIKKISGTKAGGRKAAETNKRLHGEDFYQKIGRKGGSVCGRGGGFAANKALACICGAKGGRISRRGIAKYGRDDNGNPIRKDQAKGKISEEWKKYERKQSAESHQ